MLVPVEKEKKKKKTKNKRGKKNHTQAQTASEVDKVKARLAELERRKAQQTELDALLDVGAATIQAHVRGYLNRQALRVERQRYTAAVGIQSAARRRLSQQDLARRKQANEQRREGDLQRRLAATLIQAAVRGRQTRAKQAELLGQSSGSGGGTGGGGGDCSFVCVQVRAGDASPARVVGGGHRYCSPGVRNLDVYRDCPNVRDEHGVHLDRG